MGRITTQEFEQLFKDYPIRSQQEKTNPQVVAKLFDNRSDAVWYLLEYNPKHKVALAYVVGIVMNEAGSVSITELENILDPIQGTPRIEQDFSFIQKPLKQALAEIFPKQPLSSNVCDS